MVKITGLKGLYNRINMFASVPQKEVYDVTNFMDENLHGYQRTISSVVVACKTIGFINGINVTPSKFEKILSNDGGRISSKEEYESGKKNYHPEYNSGTNNIGKGYRRIANIVMLLARADHHTKFGHDFMLYEYNELLMSNSAIISEE